MRIRRVRIVPYRPPKMVVKAIWMASRELRHPFGQAWPRDGRADRQPNGAPQGRSVKEMPVPQLVGWPERHRPRVQAPQEELAEIIGSGAGLATERSARAFFAEPAIQAAVDREVDAWSVAPPPPMPKGTRRAMYATIGMLVVGTLLIGGQLIYHRVLMPVPVALGQAGVRRVPNTSALPPPVVPPLPMDPAPRPPQPDALEALAPDAANSLVDLAWLQIRSGDPARAFVYAHRATVADPSDEKTWSVLERTLEALRDPKRNQEAYRRCVSASPSPFGFACSRLLK
jgi:hypothetical protein